MKDLEARLKAAEAAVRQSDSVLGGRHPIPESSTTKQADASELSSQTALHSEDQPIHRRSTTSGDLVVQQECATLSDQPRPSLIESDGDLTDEGATEVLDINPLTKAVEFHGNTSSVAFIGRLRKEYVDKHDDSQENDDTERPSIAGTFHNHTFSPHSMVFPTDGSNDEQFYIPQAYIFLEAYFNNLHYIHPILDRDVFFERCKDLWQGHPERQSSGFVALYFSLMSLGSLIRTWTKESISGMDRFGWSRMLFERAQLALGKPGFNNDLETIQALFIIAKICQNELNPNLAWIYLGMAIRTSLSAGINRNTSVRAGRHTWGTSLSLMERTWWGLYSLEVELSFALGRPDTLGMDDFHNRPVPPIGDSEVDIIPSMIDLARIMRTISTGIYLARLNSAEKLTQAFHIERSIDAWVEHLPSMIRPTLTPDVQTIVSLRDPAWAHLQRLVLQLRKSATIADLVSHKSSLQGSHVYLGLHMGCVFR